MAAVVSRTDDLTSEIDIRPALPVVPASSVPSVSAAQMGEVDRLAVHEFGIALLQMVEQAGSQLAELARLELGGDLRRRRVLLAIGPGNNGAGGLCAARHLADRGAEVRVVLARPVRRLSEAGRHHVATLLQMSVPCCVAGYDLSDGELDEALRAADLTIDAMLGYRAAGPPRGEVGGLIRLVSRARASILSLDLPSGIDADTGVAAGEAVTAAATLTLALPKRGLLTVEGARHSGRVYVADIGIPAALYARMGLSFETPFADGRIVRIEVAS